MAFLNLWNYVKEQQKALSGNQFRKQMGREFIHFMRLREWQDIYTQSRQTVREMGLSINEEPATFEQVHRALITGLLSQVGFKEDRHEYQGTRQTRFHIFRAQVCLVNRPSGLLLLNWRKLQNCMRVLMPILTRCG